MKIFWICLGIYFGGGIFFITVFAWKLRDLAKHRYSRDFWRSMQIGLIYAAIWPFFLLPGCASHDVQPVTIQTAHYVPEYATDQCAREKIYVRCANAFSRAGQPSETAIATCDDIAVKQAEREVGQIGRGCK